MLLIFIRVKRTFLLSSFDLILNLATNKQKRSETTKKMSKQRENERTENERTENERTESERTEEWKNDWDERARLQAYAALVRSSIVTTSRLFNDWWDKIINIKSTKLINSSFNEKNQRKRRTSESFSLSSNVEKCRKWCIDIRYNTAVLNDSAYFIQRRAHQILESDESFVDNWRKWWRCWFYINWFHQSQNQSEWTIARLVVYLINIVAFTSHSLIVFFTSAHSAHLRERILIQHRLLVFKHNWQNVVASLLVLRIRSTVTWWLWDWSRFSTFMTDNLYSNREWVIKWSNDERESDEKMLFYVQNYSFIFSHAASFFISFMIIDLRFRHITFEQRVFLIIVLEEENDENITKKRDRVSEKEWSISTMSENLLNYSRLVLESFNIRSNHDVIAITRKHHSSTEKDRE